MTEEAIPRRNFLLGAGLAGTAVATGLTQPAAAEPQPAPAPARAAAPEAEPLLILNETEHAFIVAAVDTLIPADELSPSGSDCGVATFIDRQLAGAYGAGARLYRDGPFAKAKPEFGYQLPLNPREFFRVGIAAANDWSRKTYSKDFDRLADADRVAALKAMEGGTAEFAGVSSRGFFEALLQITMEGFFADPRLDATETVSLSDLNPYVPNESDIALPLPACAPSDSDCLGYPFPYYFVPPGTTELEASATATAPVTFDLSVPGGDPDVSPAVSGPAHRSG